MCNVTQYSHGHLHWHPNKGYGAIGYKTLSTEEVTQLYSRTGDSGELQQAEFVWGSKLISRR